MPHDSRLKGGPISRSYKPTRKNKITPRTPCGLFFSGRHLTCTIPWLIQKTQGPATPSTALSTKGPPVGLSNPMRRCQVARKVVRSIKSEYISTWAFIPEPFCLWLHANRWSFNTNLQLPIPFPADPKLSWPSYSVHCSFYERSIRVIPTRRPFEPHAPPSSAHRRLSAVQGDAAAGTVCSPSFTRNGGS
jgi:hypothetical protein